MLFLVAFGALALGGLLILLISRFSPEAVAVQALEERRQAIAAGQRVYPDMPFGEWRVLIIDLLEALGFQVALEHSGGTDLEVIARSSEPLRAGKFLVRAVLAPSGDRVSASTVLELLDAVRGDGAQKGLLFTPHEIESEGLAATPEQLELIDGRRLRELLAEHLPSRLDAIEGYRGF